MGLLDVETPLPRSATGCQWGRIICERAAFRNQMLMTDLSYEPVQKDPEQVLRNAMRKSALQQGSAGRIREALIRGSSDESPGHKEQVSIPLQVAHGESFHA